MDLGKLMEGVSKIQSLPQEERDWLLSTVIKAAERHKQLTNMGIARTPDDDALRQRRQTIEVVLGLLGAAS